MANRRSPPRGAHALMWSSPLLLLVLLFTLTATSTPTTPPVVGHSITTTRAPATPTTSSPAPTSSTAPRPTTTTSATPSTTAPSRARSSPTTVASAAPVASAGALSVSDGALRGALAAGAETVVPLRGPGRWSLVSRGALEAQLSCPSGSGPVVAWVVVTTRETCQLILASAPGASWTLQPVG